MFLSPPEIKQQQLREKRGAYEREDVDALIDNVVGSYQHVWLERDRLNARVEELEKEMANTKELEQLLRDGLASAQRAAEQVKEEAEKQVSGLVDEARSKAETLLAEARAKAEEIVAESRETRDRLEAETSRLTQANDDVRERYKAFLLEALKVVEATAEHKAVAPEEVAVAEADESAPVPEPEPEQDSTLEQAGWLATVPLVAVTADSVDESVGLATRRRSPSPSPSPSRGRPRTRRRTRRPPCCCPPSRRPTKRQRTKTCSRPQSQSQRQSQSPNPSRNLRPKRARARSCGRARTRAGAGAGGCGRTGAGVRS